MTIPPAPPLGAGCTITDVPDTGGSGSGISSIEQWWSNNVYPLSYQKVYYNYAGGNNFPNTAGPLEPHVSVAAANGISLYVCLCPTVTGSTSASGWPNNNYVNNSTVTTETTRALAALEDILNQGASIAGVLLWQEIDDNSKHSQQLGWPLGNNVTVTQDYFMYMYEQWYPALKTLLAGSSKSALHNLPIGVSYINDNPANGNTQAGSTRATNNFPGPSQLRPNDTLYCDFIGIDLYCTGALQGSNTTSPSWHASKTVYGSAPNTAPHVGDLADYNMIPFGWMESGNSASGDSNVSDQAMAVYLSASAATGDPVNSIEAVYAQRMAMLAAGTGAGVIPYMWYMSYSNSATPTGPNDLGPTSYGLPGASDSRIPLLKAVFSAINQNTDTEGMTDSTKVEITTPHTDHAGMTDSAVFKHVVTGTDHMGMTDHVSAAFPATFTGGPLVIPLGLVVGTVNIAEAPTLPEFNGILAPVVQPINWSIADVQYPVTSSLTSWWNTLDPVRSTTAANWETLERVICPAQVLWYDLERMAISSTSFAWDIGIHGSSDTAYAWDTLKTITAALGVPPTLTFGPVTHPIDFELPESYGLVKWNTAGHVTKTEDVEWDIREKVKSTARSTWDIRQEMVLPVKEIEFNDLKRVTSTRSLKWDTLKRVDKTASCEWTLIGFITKKVCVRWNVMKTSYNGIKPIEWDILVGETAAKKSNKFLWNDLKRVTSSKTIEFNTRKRVHQTATCEWDAVGRLKKTATIEWNVHRRMFDDLPILWNTLYRKSASTGTQWNFVNPVTKTVTCDWNTRQRVKKPGSVKWNTLRPVVRLPQQVEWVVTPVYRIKSLATVEWDTLCNSVTSSKMATWNTRKRIHQTADSEWDSIIRRSSLVLARWDTHDQVSVPVATISWRVGQPVQLGTRWLAPAPWYKTE